MADKKIYLGSVGPFLYDDTDLIDDPDGDFAGEQQSGLRTSGPIRTDNPPVESTDVLRKGDLAALGGATGSFEAGGYTITVTDGLITGIVASDKDVWMDD